MPLRDKSCASGVVIADVQQSAHALDARIILSFARWLVRKVWSY
jgi:hypothetical protein